MWPHPYLIYSLAAALIAATNLVLAFITYRANPKGITNRTFALISLCLGSWTASMSIAYLFKETANIIFWTRLSYIGPVVIPPLFYIFVVSFPNKQINLGRNQLLVLFLPAFILEFLVLSKWNVQGVVFRPWGINFVWGWVIKAYALYFILFMGLCFIKMLQQYKAATGMVRLQLQYLLWGVYTLATIGIIFNLVLPSFGIAFFAQFGALASIILVATVTYSIVKHRLMDIRVIVRKSLVYSSIVALFTGIYLVLIFMLSQTFQIFTGQSSMLVAIFLLLVFAFLFQPLKNRAQLLVDKIFFKEKYDYQKTLKELSHASTSVVDLEALLQLVSKTVMEKMKIKGASVYVMGDRGDYRLKMNVR